MDEIEKAIERVNEAIEKAPEPAEMFYEDENADRVARVIIRVEWANGKIREYEAAEPEDFSMNDPETDLPSVAPMRRAVQAAGSPWVPMFAAVPSLRLSFRANPKRNMHIRTERTAGPSGGDGDEGEARRVTAGDIIADRGDGEADQFPALLQGRVEVADETPDLG